MKRVACLVLLLFAVALCVGCTAPTETVTYTSTAKIRLDLPRSDVDDLIGIYLINDVDGLFKSDAVLLNVIESEKLSCSAKELSSMIRVQRASETENVYLVSVDASLANDAARIANAVAVEFCDKVNRVDSPNGMEEPVAEVLEKATAPTAPK